MRYLRIVIIAYALLYIVIGIVILQEKKTIFDWWLILYFLVNACVIIIGTFFERNRYKSKNTLEEGWIKTNERFIDPNGNNLVDVYFHPKTGERKYQQVDK